MDWRPHITADPAITHGAVCFRGTRIPVSVVLDNLAAGETRPMALRFKLAGVRLAAVERSSGQLWVSDEKRVWIRG